MNHFRAWLPLSLAILFSSDSAVLAADVSSSTYRNWETYRLANEFVEVQIAPQIGGRVIQLKLDDYEFLWVNPELAGTGPSPSGLDPEGEWLNYGGDKLWPAPQGWDGDHQWPGPPDAVLDGSPHAASIVSSQGDRATIRLTSREDPRSGIQFSRDITVFDNSARVHFKSTMTNIDTKPRRWGIWQVTQHRGARSVGEGHSEDLLAYCPMNPKSRFAKGYCVMFGIVNNPSFLVDPETEQVRIHYKYRVGKIGIDSMAGWLAVVHADSGHAFVTRFEVHPGRAYPDDTSVQFWSNGVGEFYSEGEFHSMPDDPVVTPALIESEVLSPLAELSPGESAQFNVDWYACRISPRLPVIDCNDVGIVCQPVAARVRRRELILSGDLGVFQRGRIGLILRDAEGRELASTSPSFAVSPRRPVSLATLSQSVSVPINAKAVEVVMYNSAGEALGTLTSAPLQD